MTVLEDIIKLEVDAAAELHAVQDDIDRATKGLLKDREALYKRRQELVTGKALPTQEELQEWLEEHGGAANDAGTGGSSIKGVPYFWLTVLCNQDTISEEVSSRDKQALSFCTSIRATYPSKGGPPTLEMSFAANPFFSNSLLKRCLGDRDRGVPEVTTDIDWKDTAHKLTIREVTKKSGGKKGGKGSKGSKGGKGGSSTEDEPAAAAATKTKFKPCSSFFELFLQDTSKPAGLPFLAEGDEDEEEEAEDEEQSAKQQKDALLMAVLCEEVLPKAVTLYTTGPLQAPSDEDEEDSDFQVVHGPVGDSAADLPQATKKVLAALQHNQAQLDALAQAWQQTRRELKAKQSQLRLKLFGERKALLLPQGASEPTVPRFWLRVLKAADAAALAISPRDAAVLASLADVRFSLDPSADVTELHGTWELEFLPNPYLQAPASDAAAADSRPLLVKSCTFEAAAGSDRLLHSKVVSAPHWASPAKDPTHKVGRDGKQRPASSIFQLFKAGGGKYAFNLAGNAKDVQDEANELETELLQELLGHLLLSAGQVYKQQQQEGLFEEDSAAEDQRAWEAALEAESEEEGDEGTGSEQGDEAEAAHQAAAKRQKQRKGWKPSRGELLMILLAMVLLAEVFVFLDMAGLFGR